MAGGTTNADLIPRTEAQKAFKERDNAKADAKRSNAIIAALATKFGIDPSEMEIVPGENGAFDVKGESITRVTDTLTAAERTKVENQKKLGKWEDREKELNDAWTKKLQKATADAETKSGTAVAAATKRAKALEGLIGEDSVVNEIRSAALAEGAFDPKGDGRFDDLTKLIGNRVKLELEIDEETGRATKKVTVLSDDGTTPMLDEKGQPAGVRKLMAAFLADRPHMKASKTVRGPGAGGYGNATHTAQGAGPMSLAERGKAVGLKVFGAAGQI
jgi:hypothetical protein